MKSFLGFFVEKSILFKMTEVVFEKEPFLLDTANSRVLRYAFRFKRMHLISRIYGILEMLVL